jgi:hypothetical protein
MRSWPKKSGSVLDLTPWPRPVTAAIRLPHPARPAANSSPAPERRGPAQRSGLIRSAPEGTFFTRAAFTGSDRAVESALSRLAAHGELLRVRRGLYWKGKSTRFGMTRPAPLQVALQVAGPGSGPAGVAAAHMLGLTTQVPSTSEVAVPGRVPESLDGVRFRSRSFERRLRGLRPLEVAVLEVLRDPGAVEVEWTAAARRFSDLADVGEIRLEVVSEEAEQESVLIVRARLRELAL